LYLLQQDSHPFAGSFNPHFQRGDSDSCEFRHLFVPEFFHMFQEEGLTLILVQRLQRSVNLLPPGFPFRRMVF
jgi:hypothetical protein